MASSQDSSRASVLRWGIAGLEQERVGVHIGYETFQNQGLPVFSYSSLAPARDVQALGAGGRERKQRKSQK